MDDLVEGGHIDAGDAREAQEELGAGEAPLAGVSDALADVDDELFAVAQKDGVEGGREGLTVPGRGAAGKDDGVVLVAL